MNHINNSLYNVIQVLGSSILVLDRTEELQETLAM
jgi:hypothetical protein